MGSLGTRPELRIGIADDVPLAFYQPAGLFLKAEARIFIEVKLPEIKVSGVTVSNWEVMEKLKSLSKPEEFQTLRVARYSRERIEFEGEFESLRPMRKVVLLLNGKSMKLSGFTELLKIKARHLETPFPTKKEWEDYFADRGVQAFDEAKPGERPDTLRIKGLPVKWFASKTSEGKPCPRVLTQAFQKFGKVRQVGIYDSSSSSSSSHSESGSFSSFGPGSGARCMHFEVYIQYDKYAAFCAAMSSLKGMKILRLEEGGREALAKVSVDFDKTAFLSDRNVRKRRHAEERRQREREEIEREKERERIAEEQRERVSVNRPHWGRTGQEAMPRWLPTGAGGNATLVAHGGRRQCHVGCPLGQEAMPRWLPTGTGGNAYIEALSSGRKTRDSGEVRSKHGITQA